MNIYFLRHGQTDYNIKNLINCDPKTNIGLNETGRKQALEAARRLNGVKFDVVFVSEFLRTQETANFVNSKGGYTMKIDKRLNEFNSGMEGRNVREYWEKFDKQGGKKHKFKIEGKESYEDVKNRVEEFIEELREAKYRDVLVITHEAVIKMARVILDKVPIEEAVNITIGNAEYLNFVA